MDERDEDQEKFDAPDCFLGAKDTRPRYDMPRIADVVGASGVNYVSSNYRRGSSICIE
jgi:hypothetical protein